LGGCEGLSDNTLLAIAEFTPKLRSLDLTKVAQVTGSPSFVVVQFVLDIDSERLVT